MKPKYKKPLAYRSDSDINVAAQKELNNDSILTDQTFAIAIFTKEYPQQPRVYNYSPHAETDDALLFNLDTLPKEAVRAINVLHEANSLAITRHKKRHLSPDINKIKGGSAHSSGSKKKENHSPTLRHLKNTKLALQEKAKYYEQQRLF